VEYKFPATRNSQSQAVAKVRKIQKFPPGSSTAAPLNLRYRLGKIKKLGLLRGQWLDYGCADGAYTVELVNAGASGAVGVEVIASRIEQARERDTSGRDIRFIHVTSDKLPFPDASFDGVLMNEVLEHVYDEQCSLREIKRILKPGGHLIIMSPNRWFPFEGHGAHIGRYQLPWPVPFLPWLPNRLGNLFMNARNYWPKDIRHLVEGEGYSVEISDFVWPVLEVYRWLPAGAIRVYQNWIPILERTPVVRRFGVSVFIDARKIG
jgi:ubiquinone/menaquinone biosynthesis C-methylase UbiE